MGGVFERATDGVRTRDLRLGKPPLCQLSYCRIKLVLNNSRLRRLLHSVGVFE